MIKKKERDWYSVCIEQLLDWIYPKRCPICQEIIFPKGEKVCPACRKKVVVIQEPYCKKCGKPLQWEEQEYCLDCENHSFHYQYGVALWLYEGEIKRSFAGLKYQNKKEYLDFYIEEMVRYRKKEIMAMQAQALLPVPIHPVKKRKRGFNQAECLARALGEALHIPVITDLLIRRKNTVPQKNYNRQQRKKNLEDAFAIVGQTKKRYPRLQRVILVDDIYTTGSTIEACTKQLQQAGIKTVYFVSFCIGNVK